MRLEARTVRLAILLAALLGIGRLATVAVGQELPYDRPPIDYLKAPVNDPVARLQARMDRGEVSLEYDPKMGYLPSVLEELGIPPESQMLVFSKTSFQHTRISPRTPRAIYFGDDAYLGWIRGGDVLEISAVDPKQGAVFYLLDVEEAEKPTFERQTHSCLACHNSGRTQGVPGHLVRSVYSDPGGQPVYNAGSFVTDHTSPLKERWGGWYVTGTHGDQRHMGNVFVRNPAHPERLDTDAGANVTDLSDRFDTDGYLSGHSDIVALMVLEHQTQMHNYLTAANYTARLARAYDEGINKALDRPLDEQSDTTRRRLDSAADDVVQSMLFCGEKPLTDPIAGTSGFAEEFADRGPRDPEGRSLRDFDLKTRLFRYPCSYLIYSEAFDALPAPVKDRIYQRLLAVLNGEDTRPEFAHLTPELRAEILAILRATKPGFPAS